ncbi:hypothetical protein ADINL_2972 [Nitrincola lacisaponensis]|uniref:Uncharacterized protein n=1 Tax=Nitrincola lacisaponensis TaxID=267850 RepID=A0A063Y1Z9_9GAMM|nr:hypothetical protein ADINL_2972 [Nitrincola lacisaponensis]
MVTSQYIYAFFEHRRSLFLTIVLGITISFRMQAIKATLGSFPEAFKRV